MTMPPAAAEAVEPSKFDVVEELRWAFRVLYSAVERFYWDNGFTKAASLAYTSILSIVPFFTLGFGMVTAFATGDYVAKVQSYIFHRFVPDAEVADEIVHLLTTLTQQLTSVSKSSYMVAFFVLTSLLLINAIEAVLNDTWQVYEPRPIIQRIGIFSTIILLAPVIAISAYTFMELSIAPLLGNGRVVGTLELTVPFFIATIAFICLFYFVPKAPVKLKSATFGGLITSVLFMLAYGAFAVYLKYATYSVVYSTLAGIPIFLVWLYSIWIVVLFGAECSYQAQYLPRHGKSWARSVHTLGDGQLVLAVQSLIIITRAFLDGKPLPDSLALAERLGCSSVILKPSLDHLEKAGVIIRGDSRDRPISLMKSPHLITLEDLSVALFKGRFGVRFPAETASLFQALSEHNGSRTLFDLVNNTKSQ
jgi:membrane protein